ncbi:MAG: MoaD/ThiS family protein [Candidatus Ranarchaeia archaeon]
MSIEIRFFGLLRNIIGKKVIEITIPTNSPNNKLKDHLVDVFKIYPKLKEEILNETEDGFKSQYRLLLNSKEITFKNPLDTVIKENDVLQFFPPISGG